MLVEDAQHTLAIRMAELVVARAKGVARQRGLYRVVAAGWLKPVFRKPVQTGWPDLGRADYQP